MCDIHNANTLGFQISSSLLSLPLPISLDFFCSFFCPKNLSTLALLELNGDMTKEKSAGNPSFFFVKLFVRSQSKISSKVTDLFRTDANFFKAAVEDLQICCVALDSIKHIVFTSRLSENSTPVPTTTNQRCSKVSCKKEKKRKAFNLTVKQKKRVSFSDSRTAIFQAVLLKALKLQKA
ncbi:hypothetical protein V6N12_040041 [Hibiscus sabdariffa]|uniref:Uncharacterized protein n=1 Tax=Hibiscus sabdariffa TaxID=183260 RepID=A0ABR2E2J7_9ROSI